MKRFLCFLLLMALISPAIAQSQFGTFYARVTSAPVWQRTAIVDSFINAVKPRGIPVIEGDSAYFLYRSSASSVFLAGDMDGWSPTSIPLPKFDGTNLFYCSMAFPPTARLDYKFVENGTNWVLDPLNPNTCSGGYGPNSELAMPGYVQPWEIRYRASVRHGQLVSRTVHSNIVGSNYGVKVYLPPGYDTTKTYGSVYFQDGSDYLTLGSAVNVLDNLIDSMLIQPVIAVFVTPNNRNEEYAGSLRNAYHGFFAGELVPLIDSLYRTRRDAAQRMVLGDSYGGNISALITYYHPDVFGNCGLHSGAFQNFNYEADSLWYRAAGSVTMNFVSVWGTYEPLWRDMRNFRDTMTARGHSFVSLELPEGHSWGQWRATIDVLLTPVFPGIVIGVGPDAPAIPSRWQLLQNYPNPFNPTTTISYTLPFESRVSLKVYDALGQEVSTLVDAVQQAGYKSERFNAGSLASGLYFYRLSASAINGTGYFTDVKKLLLVK